jgi:uncharacterized protein (DUF362 family)
MADPDRRRLLKGTAALAAVSVVGAAGTRLWRNLRQPPRRVWIGHASTYDGDLADVIGRGLANYADLLTSIRGRHVLLKPNFVEFHPGRPINTDVRFVAAAVEAFRRAGAGRVTVGEGPGHFRDTDALLEHAGLGPLLRDAGAPFVDLNLEPGVRTELPANRTGLGTLPVARAVRAADVVVSVAKLKVHHWAGATLTMKNLFGVVPSAEVGWPKNPLHWAGIDRSVVDLWDAVRPAFGIVDGIVGMEGDGPIMGTAKEAGVVLMGDDLPAVDATCCRVMGIDPDRVAYLWDTALLGGTTHVARIEAIGEPVAMQRFALPDHLRHLAL